MTTQDERIEALAEDAGEVLDELIGDEFPWFVLLARWSPHDTERTASCQFATNISRDELIGQLEAMLAHARAVEADLREPGPD